MANNEGSDPVAAGEPQPYSGRRPSAVTRLNNGYVQQRRSAVSAESMDPSKEVASDRVVHEKTDEARAQIRAAIGNNLLFRDLDGELFEDVVDAMFEKEIADGESPIVQGDDGDYYYIIKEGTFDIFVNDNKVVSVGPGDSFGELALMYFAPRAATVTAVGPAVLWGLDRMTFRRTLMEKTSNKRKQYESCLEEVPILDDLDPGERARIADVLHSSKHADGEVIIKQGDEGDQFYILVEGTASVRQSRDGGPEIELVRLKKGNYFGEMALLLEEPRAASVVALQNCETVCLDRASFIRLLGPVKDILHRNLDHYETYEQILSQYGKTMEDTDVGPGSPLFELGTPTPNSNGDSMPAAAPSPLAGPASTAADNNDEVEAEKEDE